MFKGLPVQSADPSVIPAQNTQYVPELTYNEAHKASLKGMKIVQGAAISMAKRFKQPMKVVPIDEPEKLSVIKSESDTKETVKCVTGKTGCAILLLHDEKSRS